MAASQVNISQPKLRSVPIPIPPLAEQHRIVAKVDELMTLCDRLKASLQTAQATQLHLADSLVEAAIH
jgi:type I restriction enzyme S subunit